MIPALRHFTAAALVAVAAVALVLLGLALAGWPAHIVLRDWITGALGDRWALASTLRESCPLLLTGLAVGIAFRSGVLNIGAEGQFIWGQLLAVAVATRIAPHAPPLLTIPTAILAGTLAGSLWAGIAALLDRTRGVPVVLSTILLNFIALYALALLLLGPLRNPLTPGATSDMIPRQHWLPVFMNGTTFHAGVAAAFAIAAVAWLVQSRTTFGFELLVTGLNDRAARLAGMPVATRRAQTLLLSGAFAGLAGAFETLGVTHGLSNAAPHYGYAGIAVAMLGRLHPAGIALAALFFAALDTGARSVEKNLAIPHDIADVVKGAIVLAMLVGTVYLSRRALAPIRRDDPPPAPTPAPEPTASRGAPS